MAGIAREKGRWEATYSNGRGERSQAERGDPNVPLQLACELIGRDRWAAPLLANSKGEAVNREASPAS